MAIPTTISEETGTDVLAQFSDLMWHDNPAISADDVWEEVLNPFLNLELGWNVELNLDVVI